MSDLRGLLDEIERRRGAITPKIVVEEAQAPDSPLHDRFTWDDRVAGPKFREMEARRLIKSVRVVYTDPDNGDRQISTARYVSILRPDSAQRSYRDLERVADDPIASAILLREAAREWRNLRNRYRAIDGFLEMIRSDIADVG